MEKLAPLIAVVGCDGSGKSTLAADLLAHIQQSRGAEAGYLGLGSGAMGKRIKRWPLIGPAFEAYLSRKADQARDSNGEIPGFATALVLYRLSLKRKRQFERILALRRAGTVVVADRYPQIEVPGFYDGPGLSAARARGWLVRKLQAKERTLYAWMASYRPTQVIRLNVDVETAMARKPDHDRHLIEAKVAVTPRLSFNGAPIVDLDSTQPYATVWSATVALVDKVLETH